MEPVHINIKEFEAKYRSKREVYTFMSKCLELTLIAIDGNAYLPPCDTLSIYFLKALVGGTSKRFVSCDRVRYLNVPQCKYSYANFLDEELSLAKIAVFLSQFPEMQQYLPETDQECKKLPRGWVINVSTMTLTC